MVANTLVFGGDEERASGEETEPLGAAAGDGDAILGGGEGSEVVVSVATGVEGGDDVVSEEARLMATYDLTPEQLSEFRSFFSRIDLDGDSFVNPDEVKIAMARFGTHLSATQLQGVCVCVCVCVLALVLGGATRRN